MSEHVGEEQQRNVSESEAEKRADENGTTSQEMMVSKMDNKKIYLPIETYTEILAWITGMELAQTVSLVNWFFNAISRPRIDDHNKRIVPKLIFSNDGNGISKLLWNGRQIPIAQVPPPINILGFEKIDFHYIDAQVLEFMRLIKPIFRNVFVSVFFSLWNFYDDEGKILNVHQFFNIIKGNVSRLSTTSKNFNLMNIEFLKTIQIVQLYFGGETNKRNLLEWIHSPLDDNKTRYMFIHMDDIIQVAEICKTRFLESIVPISFVLYYDYSNFIVDDAPIFSIENNETGEQLITRWEFDDRTQKHYYFMCRSKIGDDQGWRKVIMRNIQEHDERQTTMIINLDNRDHEWPQVMPNIEYENRPIPIITLD